jgi:hypothetical protein
MAYFPPGWPYSYPFVDKTHWPYWSPPSDKPVIIHPPDLVRNGQILRIVRGFYTSTGVGMPTIYRWFRDSVLIVERPTNEYQITGMDMGSVLSGQEEVTNLHGTTIANCFSTILVT